MRIIGSSALLFLGTVLFPLGAQPGKEDPPQLPREEALLAGFERATLAGGCFWCMESPYEKLRGVTKVISGYTGGHLKNPTYEQVTQGTTGHLEAVQVYFDPRIISYKTILEFYWRQFDPTDDGGSFGDRGEQYKSAIFYHSEEQRVAAEASRQQLGESKRYDRPIVTDIRQAEVFFPAEDYHQDYYKKNFLRYENYRRGSGRAGYLAKLWGEDDLPEGASWKMDEYADCDKETRLEELSPLQREVTQKGGTERPFENDYWNNKQEGIYVDIVSGEPLFSSAEKYESGTGWPSFYLPLEPDNITYHQDSTLSYPRIEVKSKYGGSHLGHVFEDGPAPTGLRYCVNSASLRFIPREKLTEEGYGDYLGLFEGAPEKTVAP